MDQINEIDLEGYRLFNEKRTIAFSVPGPNSIGLNIIVGPNNVGKSSLINLIGGNYFSQINREDWSGDSTIVRVKCQNKSALYDYTQANIMGNPKASVEPEGQWPNLISMFLPSDRKWAFESSNLYLGPGMSINPDASEAELIQQFSNVGSTLSNTFSSNQNYKPVKKPNETFLGTLLFISHNSSLKNKYTTLVRELIPNYQDFELLKKRGNKYQILYKSAEDRGYIDMELTGDGVQTIMVICAYLLLIRESRGNGAIISSQPIQILVLDEPETSLHPQAQKRLYEYIKEIAQNIQVIYATHSPYLVSWDIISKGGRIIRLDSKDGNQAEVYYLDKSNQPASFSTQPRRRSTLDIISREIFFTDKVVIVEGLDDANILRSFIEDKQISCSFEICGHGADSAGNILKWMKVARALGIKVGAIFDSDVDDDYNAALDEFGVDFVKVWSTNDIRDKKGCVKCTESGCQECEWGGKVGLFKENGVIKEDSLEEVTSVLKDLDTALSY